MNIRLCKMTKELCRAYFRDFVNDPNVYEDLSQFRAYEYSDSHVDEYWQKQQSLDRSHLAIMLDDKPIGEIIFKRIDRNERTCTLSIHLQNDNVKNQGYGTRAEILALDFAFRELNMISVYADAIHKNRRSQHVLEKVGFQMVGQDDTFLYYCCNLDEFYRRKPLV
ncbi:MAG: GNAT family N-acetyltransferase [Oscillospiraceae bacterium]|nr:GNAT family N-acetyltransferase [Oscillospiraceae bacterium]